VIDGCDGLYYERTGFPERLIVSDFPLEDSAHTAMHQMTQAIKLTLKDRGFRAGRFSVGYVVCDDSVPAGTWSSERSIEHGRAGSTCRSSRTAAPTPPTSAGYSRARRERVSRMHAGLRPEARSRFRPATDLPPSSFRSRDLPPRALTSSWRGYPSSGSARRVP